MHLYDSFLIYLFIIRLRLRIRFRFRRQAYLQYAWQRLAAALAEGLLLMDTKISTYY